MRNGRGKTTETVAGLKKEWKKMTQGDQVGYGLLARDAGDSRDGCGYDAVKG